MSASVTAVVAAMRSVADPSRTKGMARVGITVDRAIGVSIPQLRRIARELSLAPRSIEPQETTIGASAR